MICLNRFLLVLILVCSWIMLSAQPAPPDSANPAPLPGVVLIMAAGASYGAFKTYRKINEEEEE
ncbi:MAG: hypothetical protein ACJAZH_000808 [Roseivirga sp.]|jgi:hypothetical protein